MQRRTFLGATTAFISGFAAPTVRAAGRTVTDVLGRTITVPDEPQRILLGFYYEDFWSVGGRDVFERVVAISRRTWEGYRSGQWQRYLAVEPRLATLVDVGDVESQTFSVESAIAARPDLAVLAAWQFDGLAGGVGMLEAAGIPVVIVDYNAQTVERHVASTLLLGELLGGEAVTRARELATTYETSVAEVRSRVAQMQAAGRPAPRVYVELARKGPQEMDNTYGKGMWANVIEAAGGHNIATGRVGAWGPLDPEYVLAADPEFVFLAGSEWTNAPEAVLAGFGIDPELTRTRMRAYLTRPGWSDLTAVRKGEVHAIYHGGNRTLSDYCYLQYMAKCLWPDAFADVDPSANLRAHYRRWLPIEPDGTFMLRL